MAHWQHPEGVRVLADGAWQVGEFAIVHQPSLRFLKARLVFEEHGAFLVEGQQRLPVVVEGPAFEVTRLAVLPERGEAIAVLDDGSEETLHADSLSADDHSGRVECLVRGGRARARLSRAAHQALLEHVEETRGHFFLRVGSRRLSIRAGA
jgi:hypothetical protein